MTQDELDEVLKFTPLVDTMLVTTGGIIRADKITAVDTTGTSVQVTLSSDPLIVMLSFPDETTEQCLVRVLRCMVAAVSLQCGVLPRLLSGEPMQIRTHPAV